MARDTSDESPQNPARRLFGRQLATAGAGAAALPLVGKIAMLPKGVVRAIAAELVPEIQPLLQESAPFTNFSDIYIGEHVPIEAMIRTGLPLKNGKIDVETYSFYTNLGQQLNGAQEVARNLKLCDITQPDILAEALRIAGIPSKELKGQAHILQQFLGHLIRVSGVSLDSTYGNLLNTLQDTAADISCNIMAHPELMPTQVMQRMEIYRIAHNTLSEFHYEKGDPELETLSMIDAEIRKVQKNSFSVMIMAPDGKDSEKAGSRAFLFHPEHRFTDKPPSISVMTACVRRLCLELKKEGILDDSFRPASLQVEWLAAGSKDDTSSAAFGLRIRTANPQLKAYLTKCANQKEVILLPDVSPQLENILQGRN